MNSAFVKEQAEAFARRLIDEVQGDEPRVSRLYQLAYGRDPDSAEKRSIREFLNRYRAAAVHSKTTARQADVQALTAMCRVVLTSNEFFFID